MIDFDINASDRVIRDSVYDASELDPKPWRDRLIYERLRTPLVVLAARGAVTWPGPERCWACTVHRGLTYLTVKTTLKSAAHEIENWSRAVGGPIRLTHTDEWLTSVRLAIVDLRRDELNLHDDITTITYDFEDERRARAIAVGMISRGEIGWEPPLSAWIGIVMRRHHAKLDTVRRKIVELLTAFTAPIDPGPGLAFIFKQAIQELYATFDYAHFPKLCERLICELIPELMYDERNSPRLGPVTRDAVGVMRQRFREPLSLADIAREVHVSPPHLSRQFKSDTGQTLTDRLHQMRIAHARQLLHETDQSVLEVAMNSGFDSPEHFHRIFKRHAGVTPRHYRVGRR